MGPKVGTTKSDTTKGVPLNTPELADEGSRIRVVLGKMRFDAHDVGARFIMRRLVDAGMEVIFVRFAIVADLVEAALQEDAHVIAISSLTGGHMTVAKNLVQSVRKAGLEDRLLLIGGVIADGDVEQIKAMGVAGVFGPGTDADSVVQFIKDRVELGD